MEGHTLSVLIAKKAAIALVLRRGPTKWYHLIKLSIENNSLEHGAWFKGRLYENSCDISSDGRYFLYKAFKGNNRDASYKDSFTGLSEVPWLKAHWLLPIGTTYVGGGFFAESGLLSKKTIFIYQLAFCELTPHKNHTDSKGFKVKHASDYNAAGHACIMKEPRHQDEDLIENADWSKRLDDGSIIWHKHYELYRRYFDGKQYEDSLIADLSDLKPNPQPAPY